MTSVELPISVSATDRQSDGYRQTDRQRFYFNTDGFSMTQTDRQTDRQRQTEFKTWRRRLSIELQGCNARVIIRKLSRANQSRDSSTHTYSNQFYC